MNGEVAGLVDDMKNSTWSRLDACDKELKLPGKKKLSEIYSNQTSDDLSIDQHIPKMKLKKVQNKTKVWYLTLQGGSAS